MAGRWPKCRRVGNPVGQKTHVWRHVADCLVPELLLADRSGHDALDSVVVVRSWDNR